MPETGEDTEVTLDTTPIRGAVVYRSSHAEVAPGTVVYFATDGEVRVTAQSRAHADDLAEAITLVELEHFVSTGWLSLARRLVIRATAWLNRRDMRTRVS